MALIELNNLKTLHDSMIKLRGQSPEEDQNKYENQKFEIKSGAITFCCIFSIGGNNFELSLTSKDKNAEFFLFSVNNNFEIDSFFEDYKRLGRLLNTGQQTFHALDPTKFLENINAQTPRQASDKNVPTGLEIIEYRHDMEERDKPYFSHWKHHGVNKNVSEENKQKTLRILGAKALQYSDSQNASSCWSPHDTHRR